MVCCLLCFSDDPIEGDQRGDYQSTFAISMMDAPCREPVCFCLAYCCPVCSQYKLRKDALQGDTSQYKCCQGYYDNKCFRAGTYGDRGNECCLCIEACCCHSCAVSASRQLVMDTRNLRPDPCDNRIIRFSNCVQLLACVFNILALIESSFRDLAEMLDIVADIVYFCTAACMTAQAHHEITRAPQMAQPVVLNWVAVQNVQDFRFQQKFVKNGAVMPGRSPQQQQQVMYPQAGVQMQPQYVQQQHQQQQVYAPQQQVYAPQQQVYAPQQQVYAPQQQVYAPQQQPMYR